MKGFCTSNSCGRTRSHAPRPPNLHSKATFGASPLRRHMPAILASLYSLLLPKARTLGSAAPAPARGAPSLLAPDAIDDMKHTPLRLLPPVGVRPCHPHRLQDLCQLSFPSALRPHLPHVTGRAQAELVNQEGQHLRPFLGWGLRPTRFTGTWKLTPAATS